MGETELSGFLSSETMEWEDYSWTCAGDEHLQHRIKIAAGGYGEVHQVSLNL
jgi:hypothetical protein